MKKNFLTIIHFLCITLFLHCSNTNCSFHEAQTQYKNSEISAFDITPLIEKGVKVTKKFFDENQQYNAFTPVTYKGKVMFIYKVLSRTNPRWIEFRTELIRPLTNLVSPSPEITSTTEQVFKFPPSACETHSSNHPDAAIELFNSAQDRIV